MRGQHGMYVCQKMRAVDILQQLIALNVKISFSGYIID